MNVCKNICDNLPTKSFTMGFSLMGDGWKKCRTCCISLKVTGFTCPCCKRKLSTRVRQRKNRSDRPKKETTLKEMIRNAN